MKAIARNSKAALMPADEKGVTLSWLWIGTWSMGGEGFGPHDLKLSLQTLEAAYETGIRHFDTAGFYAQGRSEELLKKAFGGNRRSKVFISSKGGLWREGRRVWHDARPEALKKALYQALERLGADYIDLFQLHWPDPKVPLDESIGALQQLRDQGLIRFWGAGNLTAEQVKRFIAPEGTMPHQVHFNPIHRDGLAILKAGRDCDRCINCIISPFEQGLLTSSRLLEKELGKKDVRNRNPYFKSAFAKKLASELFSRCSQQGVSPAAAVLAWIIEHQEVDIVIPGPRRPEHLEPIRTIARAREMESLARPVKDAIHAVHTENL